MIEILQIVPAVIALIVELWKTIKHVEGEFKGKGRGKDKKAAIMTAIDMAYKGAKAIRDGKKDPASAIHATASVLVDNLVVMLNGNGGLKR